MRKALNEIVVAKAALSPTGQYCIWDANLRQFALRVSTHSKTFVLKQQNRWHTLGRYPIVSLKEAREEAKRRLALKYLRHQTINARDAIREYLLAKQGTLKPSTHRVYTTYLELLDRPVQEIDARYV